MKQAAFRKWTEDIVGQARVYNWIQRTVGSSKIWTQLRQVLSNDLSHFEPQDIWVDLGCGTAEFLEHLPENIQYIGIDSNQRYISYAQKKYQGRPNTTFICGNWSTIEWPQNIRIVSLLGLLHHIPDDQAKQVISLSLRHLSPGGCIISLDGCPTSQSSYFERFFYWIDRGKHIRTEAHLKSLFPTGVTSTAMQT